MSLIFRLILVTFLSLNSFAADATDYIEEQKSEKYDSQIVEVLEVSELSTPSNLPIELGDTKEQVVKVKVISDGPEKNTELFINNIVPDNNAFAILAEKGRKYTIALSEDREDIAITDYYREPIVIALILFFLVAIIAFAGLHGVKAILSLTLTGLSIIYILIPTIKLGFNPVLMSIFIATFATGTTMILIAGFTKKALSATIGTTGGVTIAGILAYLVIKTAPLSGLANSEARILMGNLINTGNESLINFQGLLAAGILISSLGAAMDVAISIASSTQEIYLTNPNQSRRDLFKHALNVGKDIMGTMTNTLVLAYTGSSLPLFLLLHQEVTEHLLNMEIIATELSAATIGSIGLLFAIPITSISAVVLLKSTSKNLT